MLTPMIARIKICRTCDTPMREVFDEVKKVEMKDGVRRTERRLVRVEKAACPCCRSVFVIKGKKLVMLAEKIDSRELSEIRQVKNHPPFFTAIARKRAPAPAAMAAVVH